MSLTKLAKTAAQIRKSKGFTCPERLGIPAEGEVEGVLAGLANHVRALGRTAEDVRCGLVPIPDMLNDVLVDRITHANALLGLLNPASEQDEPNDHRPDAMLAKLVLVVTEVAEAMDAVIEGDEKNFAEELADILIRVFDIAGTMGINLDFEVAAKTTINAMRPRLHGKLA